LAIVAVTLWVTSSWAATNWNLKLLHNFGTGSDGARSWSAPIRDAAGNLYGTTTQGGTYGYGAVYELTPNGRGGWTETVLHSFGNDGSDGYYPYGRLLFDTAGNLYGTTQYGSVSYGTVFELSPNQGGGWTETVLYNFSQFGDGRYPDAGLIFDAAGNLYGTTDHGGAYCDLYQGCGTVFELSPVQGGGWTETLLHSFNIDDGDGPMGDLILDASGNLYGTTFDGGMHGGGTAFELTPLGGGNWNMTTLHSFGEGADGNELWGDLTFDAAGNLYGVTDGGGNQNAGTAFELSPNGDGGWTEAVLHSFGDGNDGIQPLRGTLVFDAAGNLYGTSTQGGYYGVGAVFELTPNGNGSWSETLIHNFDRGIQGNWPMGSVIIDADGNLYGTTMEGGTNNAGTVFELSPVFPCTRCSHTVVR
jgi:uncharacterized repeat protein (TIGR03803 family)